MAKKDLDLLKLEAAWVELREFLRAVRRAWLEGGHGSLRADLQRLKVRSQFLSC